MLLQKSNIQNRANKIYANKPFDLLAREIITNGLHSCIISPKTEKQLQVTFGVADEIIKIDIEDNGEGFNKYNFETFTVLDTANKEKEKRGLKHLGQGRLSILYFASHAYYTSIYEEDEKLYKRKFEYPKDEGLFTAPDHELIENDKIATKCYMEISNSNKVKYDRAKKFFDNDKSVQDIVIIELKSSGKAHNSGDIKNQVKEYAADVYNQEHGIIAQSINNTHSCRYAAVIIASKSDIEKEYKNYDNALLVI